MDDFDYDDAETFDCPRCGGWGDVECHCGGDLCVCTNYGDAPCPVCHGEGQVSEERHDRYMAAQRENARLFAEVCAKLDDERAKRNFREAQSNGGTGL